HDLRVHEYKKLTKLIKNCKHLNLTPLRMDKDQSEMNKIKKACAIGDKAFTYILKQIKVGMSEKEIAFLLETFIRKHNAEISFSSIMAFGPNAAIPHHKTGNTKLKKN